MDLTSDPINAAINEGIRRGIHVTLENECYGSTVILVYAGMDAMANLGRPHGQVQVTPTDFINWADRYLDLDGDTRITGKEWYSARCGVLHSFSSDSTSTRAGVARRLGYMSECAPPPVRYAPTISDNFVLVSVPALVEAFFAGIDRFLVERFADPAARPIMEKRLRAILAELPFDRAAELEAEGS